MDKKQIQLTEQDLRFLVEDAVKEYMIQEGLWGGLKNLGQVGTQTMKNGINNIGNGIANGIANKYNKIANGFTNGVNKIANGATNAYNSISARKRTTRYTECKQSFVTNGSKRNFRTETV